MRFCPDHWAELRKAIDDRCLSEFVAQDDVEAADRLTRGDFDPLMGAHNAIMSNGLKYMGLSVMLSNDDGSQRCVICYGLTFNEGPEAWIAAAADAQLAKAKKLGFIKEH